MKKERKYEELSKEKIQEIKKYREEGLSFKEIGKIYGVSRQRIHQIYTDYYNPPPPLNLKEKKKCSVEECNENSSTKGYCKQHYYQMKIYGEIKPVSTSIEFKRCLVDGCNDISFVKGYCGKHYSNLNKYGNPLGKIKEEKENLDIKKIKRKQSKLILYDKENNNKKYIEKKNKIIEELNLQKKQIKILEDQIKMLELINEYNNIDRQIIKKNLKRIMGKCDIKPGDIMNLGYEKNNIYAWTNLTANNIPMFNQALHLAVCFNFDINELLKT